MPFAAKDMSDKVILAACVIAIRIARESRCDKKIAFGLHAAGMVASPLPERARNQSSVKVEIGSESATSRRARANCGG